MENRLYYASWTDFALTLSHTHTHTHTHTLTHTTARINVCVFFKSGLQCVCVHFNVFCVNVQQCLEEVNR